MSNQMVVRRSEAVSAAGAAIGMSLELEARVKDAQQRAQFGQQLLQAKLADDEWMAVQWQTLHEEWLEHMRTAHSGSPKTSDNYRLATRQWREFLAQRRHEHGPEAGYPVQLWQVDARHVRQWVKVMEEAGKSPATINLKLSAVSSFYSFVSNEKRMVFGVEVCLFADAAGQPRSNPFKFGNIQRPRAASSTAGAAADAARSERAFRLHREPAAHAGGGAQLRPDPGLFGDRLSQCGGPADAVAAHPRSKSQRQRIIYAWRGKGGKEEDEPLPEVVWNAIVQYLTLDGRWLANAPLHEQPLQPDDYVFRAVTTHALKHLKNQREDAPRRPQPLSEKSAVRILRTALKHAGVPDFERVRVHDLRHTWALRMLASGAETVEIKLRAHHSSLETTAHYLSGLKAQGQDRKDLRSGRLAGQLRAFGASAGVDSWAELIEGGA